jgi:hypothetical protein
MGTTFAPQVTDAEPDELARLITQRLNAVDMPFTTKNIIDGSSLSVDTPGGRWVLEFVNGQAAVEWTPHILGALSPHELADLAAALLTGQTPPTNEPDDDHTDSITATAGKHLAEHGFKVELLVYPDDIAYDACYEIKIRQPHTRPDADATVYINNTGGLVWYHDRHIDTPEHRAAVADILTAAITTSLDLP